MPLNALGGVPGLSSLLKALSAVCTAIAKFAPLVRPFVPTGSQTNFDNALVAITAACDVIRAIEYADSLEGTNAPFGQA
jgi:hypothetical protein